MGEHGISDSFTVDAELGVTAILTKASPFWKVQLCTAGKQRRVSLRTRSKKRARSLADAIANARARSGVTEVRDDAIAAIIRPKRDVLTVGTMLQAETDRKRRKPLSRATLVNYAVYHRRIVACLHPRGAETPAVNLTSEVLESIERKLSTTGVATTGADGKPVEPRPLGSRGVSETMKFLRAAMKHAIALGKLDRDRAATYVMPAVGESTRSALTREEMQRLLQATTQPTDLNDAVRFLLATGLRAGELRWLRSEDVVLGTDNGGSVPVAVEIRDKMCPHSGQAWQPKHGRPRTVPLTLDARQIVARRVAALRGRSGWLFSNANAIEQTGKKWSAKTLLTQLQLLLRQCGIRRAVAHELRHTALSVLANSGQVELHQVQRLAGHARVSTTLRYVHTEQRELTRRLGGMTFASVAGEAIVGEHCSVAGGDQSVSGGTPPLMTTIEAPGAVAVVGHVDCDNSKRTAAQATQRRHHRERARSQLGQVMHTETVEHPRRTRERSFASADIVAPNHRESADSQESSQPPKRADSPDSPTQTMKGAYDGTG